MGFIGDLTGANIEKKLAEYSEVYGEILLGMHRDMERHQTLIREHDENMRQGVAHVNQAQVQLSQAVLAAEGYERGCKEELEKTKEFFSEVQRKWQELLSKVEGQEQEIHTLGLTFERFRTRVVWSSAAVALVVIIGGLAWIIRFVR